MAGFMRRVLGLALILGLVVSIGCGPRALNTKRTYPVRGIVTYKGKRVAFYEIHFTPAATGLNHADGNVGADGTYELRTYSNEEPDGAIPGTYNVTLENAGLLMKGQVPTKLPGEVFKKVITVEVKEEDNDIPINLD